MRLNPPSYLNGRFIKRQIIDIRQDDTFIKRENYNKGSENSDHVKGSSTKKERIIYKDIKKK